MNLRGGTWPGGGWLNSHEIRSRSHFNRSDKEGNGTLRRCGVFPLPRGVEGMGLGDCSGAGPGSANVDCVLGGSSQDL